MPVYTVKEIGELIGKPAKTIEVYCGRKKLIKNSDKRIDTSDPINELFIAKYAVQQNTIQADISMQPPSELKPDSEKKNGKDKSGRINSANIMEIDYAIKKLNAEKIQKDIQLKDIEIKKKNNELVNLEQTLSIVKAYSESIKKGIAQDVQILIQDMCSRYDIPSAKAGKYGLKVIEIINQASKESITILKELNNE